MAEEFDLTQSCDSIGQFADVPLPFLPDPPQASGTPICFAESGSPGRQLPDKGGPEPWRVHVLYVPKDVDLSQDDYLEILEQGGIDISLGFNGPERPIPGEARPDEPAGGYAPFEVRGERGVVQRFSGKRTFAVWWEALPGKGRVRHVVHGFYPPEEIVEFARGLERGRPRDERAER